MIASQFGTFLLDLDGVVYVGDRALPGARSSIRRLRNWDKTLRFLTNDPRPTREGIVARLDDFGIEAHVEEVVTCGWSTAVHLRKSGIQSAYVVGSDGLRRELEQADVHPTDGEDAEAVVVGCDVTVSYPDIRRAARLIRRGARFVATNEDATFPTPNGPAPATGTIVAAVRTASGEEPYVVGKPHPGMFRAALDDHDPEGAVMVGDRLDTDILGAQRQGLTALLLDREGTPSRPEDRKKKPDLTISSLEALFEKPTAI